MVPVPAVALEAANGAHLDAISAFCVFGLGWAAVRRRHWLAGVFLGLAGGLKLVPLLLLPVFLRRGRWRTSLTAVGLVAASYLPHLVAVGVLVLGFLPGYWQEEGYDGGRRFALLSWLPENWRMPVALAAGGLLRGRGRRPLVPRTGAGDLLLALRLLLPDRHARSMPGTRCPSSFLVIMAGRLEWLAVWAALYVAFVFDR